VNAQRACAFRLRCAPLDNGPFTFCDFILYTLTCIAESGLLLFFATKQYKTAARAKSSLPAVTVRRGTSEDQTCCRWLDQNYF